MMARGEEHPEDKLMEKLWIELAEHNVSLQQDGQ